MVEDWLALIGNMDRAVRPAAGRDGGNEATPWHVFVLGTHVPRVLGLIGFLALAANVASVLILIKYKAGDANVRSVWLCSRNDAIGNVAVMLAALGVWSTASGWPDVIVAAILVFSFLNSARKILRQAFGESRLTKGRIFDERHSKLRTVRRPECTSYVSWLSRLGWQ